MAKKKEPNPWEPESPDYTPPKERKCSFCGTLPSKENNIISAPNHIFICENCTLACAAIFYEGNRKKWAEYLIEMIISSDDAEEEPKKTRKKKKDKPEK